jgi:DNA polymerase (family X)
MKVKGLGPKKISFLYQQLGISNIDELEEAVRKNKLLALKGFTQSLQTTIIEEISRIRSSTGFILLDQALLLAEEVKERLNSFKSVDQVNISGPLKRKREVISEIVFVVDIKDTDIFERELLTLSKYKKDNPYYLIKETYPVIIKIYPATKEYMVYQDFIISAENNFIQSLPGIQKKNYKSERQIFKTISFPYIIPEMREKEYFSSTPKNSNLVPNDIQGMLHFHTTYSDGRNTLKEMIIAAKSKGYKYAAVCDHSKSAYYVNGLTEERIDRQTKEIQELSDNLDILILNGIESDILKDGSLDYSNDVLEKFQFIVASIHSRFNLSEMEMTQRIIKAVENEYTDVIGHLSGRLLLLRDAYKFNVEKVLDACVKNNVAVEINSNPRRLDIDWRYIYYARDKGCKFAINADAHSITEIDLIKYGVMMGRKAGLQKSEVINCFDVKSFVNYLNRKRKRI